MRIDDFVCLGRTVPETSKKYGHKVCMAGYSLELNGFMRIYPLPVKSCITAKGQYQIELRRNDFDNRFESWRLKEEESINDINKPVSKSDLKAFFDLHLSSSIDELNSKRVSLGVIRPIQIGKLHFVDRSSKLDSAQGLLFDDLDVAFGADAFQHAPKIQFEDDASPHDLQIREWGCYEFMRKYPETPENLESALHLRKNLEHYFVVGNMHQFRKNWLIIKTFSFTKIEQKLLDFDDLD